MQKMGGNKYRYKMMARYVNIFKGTTKYIRFAS